LSWGLAGWLRRDVEPGNGANLAGGLVTMVRCIVFAGVVFRGELVILLGPLVLWDLFNRNEFPRRFFAYLSAGVLAAIFALIMTVGIDSYFWREWLWPEGGGMYFNVIENKSSQWGTSPFLWYFYSAIPRAMSAPLIFVPLGLYFDPRARADLWPIFTFVLLYSFLPHKELRFIMYVFPVVNMVAAVGMDRLLKVGYCNHDISCNSSKAELLDFHYAHRLLVMLTE